jgi:2-C-methyl-D-erythritol 4-phosphate cytidylyltransferase/2-C-methyl-D-erythritol 2,4-cyclodiphosphate synthase
MKVGAVILAAGKGTRFGGDKLRARLGGKPVWRWSFDVFAAHPRVESIVLVCPSGELDDWQSLALDAIVVEGGYSRQDSCQLGVSALSGCTLALIHDGARPFVDAALVDRVIDATVESGAAAPVVPVSDTLRNLDGEIVDRDGLRAMQTPQGVNVAAILKAHSDTADEFTDDVALMQSIGIEPTLVAGDTLNLKITTEDDLAKARGIVGFRETRTGLGYDVHRFSSDPIRPLMIGGVRFEGAGLEGHSDADALIHAIVDAILGAASLGDIGVHFPNTDPQWKDRPSLDFLKSASEMVRRAGWAIVNVDASVISEKPKVMAQSAMIRQKLAEAIGISPDRVSVKATTNEGLGALGRSEGLAAFAVATLTEA